MPQTVPLYACDSNPTPRDHTRMHGCIWKAGCQAPGKGPEPRAPLQARLRALRGPDRSSSAPVVGAAKASRRDVARRSRSRNSRCKRERKREYGSQWHREGQEPESAAHGRGQIRAEGWASDRPSPRRRSHHCCRRYPLSPCPPSLLLPFPPFPLAPLRLQPAACSLQAATCSACLCNSRPLDPKISGVASRMARARDTVCVCGYTRM